MTYSLILRELTGPSGSVTKGSKLSIDEMDGDLIYLYNLITNTYGITGPAGPTGPIGTQGPAGTGIGNAIVLTYENANNTTISSTASVVYLGSDSDNPMYLTLPTPVVGWQMTIIRNDNYFSENTISINGPFFDGSSNYDMNYSGSNIVINYDGSSWHILSTNNSD